MSVSGLAIIYIILWWIVFFDILPIDVEMDDKEVATIFERNDLISSPVIDQNKKLIGRIIYHPNKNFHQHYFLVFSLKRI